MATDPSIRFAAVGDLLLCRPANATEHLRSLPILGPDVQSIFSKCDVIFGNLEHTLPGDGRHVPTEPRVVGDPEGIRAIASEGFDILTLANNHAFDCLESGFQNVRHLLDEIRIPYFGAGMNLKEAAAPSIVEVNGIRIAFIAAVDRRSGPFQFADTNQWGVAPLDMERLLGQIRELRSQTHHVFVSLHWGEERFLIPSPMQLEQAHALVDAGASMILGHHSHVIQGLEHYRGTPIIYSLGNFIADDVCYSNGDVLRWNRLERTGCILLADVTADSVTNLRQVPTFDSGKLVGLCRNGSGDARIQKANRAVVRGVSASRYRREHLWVKTIKPILAHLKPSEMKKIRLRHVANAIRLIYFSRRID